MIGKKHPPLRMSGRAVMEQRRQQAQTQTKWANARPGRPFGDVIVGASGGGFIVTVDWKA